MLDAFERKQIKQKNIHTKEDFGGTDAIGCGLQRYVCPTAWWSCSFLTTLIRSADVEHNDLIDVVD